MTVISLRDRKGSKVCAGDLVMHNSDIYLVIESPKTNTLGVVLYKDPSKSFEWFDISDSRKLVLSDEENDLTYENIMKVCRDFGGQFINMNSELILCKKTNLYVFLGNCDSIKEIESKILIAISSVTESGNPKYAYLVNKVNKYFGVNFDFSHMQLIYKYLCYYTRLDNVVSFIETGFDFEKLKECKGFY
jgi:hypothetical protein